MKMFTKTNLTAAFISLFCLTAQAQSWTIGGNALGVGSNDLGSTDNKSVDFITNGNVRMSLTNQGKLGIGILNPAGQMHVNVDGTISKPQLQLTELGADYSRIRFNNSAVASKYWMLNSICDATVDDSSKYKISYTGATTSDLMTFRGNGNIGISVNNPVSRLEIAGSPTSGADVLNAKVNFLAPVNINAIKGVSLPFVGFGTGVSGEGGLYGIYGFGNGSLFTGTTYGVYGTATGIAETGNRVGVKGFANSGGDANYGVWGYATGDAQINYGVYGHATGALQNYAGFFDGDTFIGGNLLVGTTNPAAGFSAHIAGKLICEELKVQLVEEWPDYVFDPAYTLMPISELERTIAEQKHLPHIPSAAEIQTNGIMVGEMQKQIVEQLENSILYIIDLQHQIDELKNEIQSLK